MTGADARRGGEGARRDGAASNQGGYRTLREGSQASGEVQDRRSRFIAQLVRVADERGAEAFVEEVRSRHHDARHNVPAWVLADGRERCSDDGEPQRTAGMPVLGVLRAAGLADVCCVVTRYFGGTLLGPGGLVRAYTAAAQAAVADAEKRGLVAEMRLVTPVVAQVPYALYERARLLAEASGGRVRDALFAEDVQLTLAFPAGEEQPFVAALRDLSGGEDLARCGEPRFGEL